MSRKKPAFDSLQAMNQVMDLLDRLCAPPVPKRDYLDVLAAVRAECAMREEGVRVEISEEEEEGA